MNPFLSTLVQLALSVINKAPGIALKVGELLAPHLNGKLRVRVVFEAEIDGKFLPAVEVSDGLIMEGGHLSVAGLPVISTGGHPTIGQSEPSAPR